MITTLIATGILLFIYLKFWPKWQKIKICPRPFLIVPLVTVVVVGIPIYGFHQFMAFLSRVPISCDCDPRASPFLIMPTEGVIYQLLLFPLPAELGGGGLGKVFGEAGKETRLSSPGTIIYRCTVVNHGSTPLFNVEMMVRQIFMESIRDSTNPKLLRSGAITLDRGYLISLSTIGVGENGKSIFYIQNSSAQIVNVTLPQVVTFQRANGDTRETAPLIQPIINMNFTPSF